MEGREVTSPQIVRCDQETLSRCYGTLGMGTLFLRQAQEVGLPESPAKEGCTKEKAHPAIARMDLVSSCLKIISSFLGSGFGSRPSFAFHWNFLPGIPFHPEL